jgi:hypothetical protein
MKKRTVIVGQRFGKLKVTRAAGSDEYGNQSVEVSCRCGNTKNVRLTALTVKPYRDKNGKMRKPVTSCGCASKEAYKEHLRRRAKKLPRRVKRSIWQDHQRGYNFSQLSDIHNLDRPLITAIVREYNSTGPKWRCATIPAESNATYDGFPGSRCPF